MKKVLFSAAMFATIAGVMLMTSCKKQQDTIVKKDAAPFEQGVSGSEQKIIDFIDSYSAFKKGAKVEGESVSLEEARWQWETTFNYCYGFTQSHLSDIRRDIIRISMPETNASGQIDYSEMLETFGIIVADVRRTYNTINLEDKTLQYIMICFGDDFLKDRCAEIVITTGRNASNAGIESDTLISMPWYGRPFVANECYWWDEAAGVIQQEIKNYDVAHWRYYTPCPDCYTYIDNIHLQNSFAYPCFDWCFHDSIARYICYQELNQIYGNIMMNTHYNGMEINPYGYDWYYETVVFPMRIDDNETYPYLLKTEVYNATRLWRHYENYPIHINEEY